MGVFHGIAVAQTSAVCRRSGRGVGQDADGTPLRTAASSPPVDCGMTVNPQTIERQIEGAIVHVLSAALSYGRIGFKDGRVEQGNFNDYPVLRMNEMPKVEVHIVQSSEKPGGIGEPDAADRAGGGQRDLRGDGQAGCRSKLPIPTARQLNSRPADERPVGSAAVQRPMRAERWSRPRSWPLSNAAGALQSSPRARAARSVGGRWRQTRVARISTAGLPRRLQALARQRW